VLVLWQPTFERIVAAVEAAERGRTGGREAPPLEVLIVPAGDSAEGADGALDLALVERLNGWLDDGRQVRLSLLLRGDRSAAIGYALLRRLQNRRWAIALAESCDRLLRGGRAAGDASVLELEIRVELARKFRLDVDLLLTLPGEDAGAEDASALLAFLASNRFRGVSFGQALLLDRLGLPPAERTAGSRFFAAFLDAWLASDRSLRVDDVRRLTARLVALRDGEESAAAPPFTFVDAEAAYPGADGPIPGLRTPTAGAAGAAVDEVRAASRRRCAASCGYYPVCGGEHYGAKQLFNGSLDSARNPYCAGVAVPLFDRVLGLAGSDAGGA
jgi:hypothetical protein